MKADSDQSNRFRRVRRQIKDLRQQLFPGERAWRGAAWGVLMGVFILALVIGYLKVSGPTPDLLGWSIVAGFILLAFLAGLLATLLQSIVVRIPPVYVSALGAAGALLAFYAGGFTPLGIALLFTGLVLPLSLTGAGVWVLAGGQRDMPQRQRAVAWSGLVLGLVSLVFVVVWLADNGSERLPAVNVAEQVGTGLAEIQLPDPSQPGSYIVEELFYGSGKDLHQDGFGSDVDIETQPVDGSAFLSGWDGPAGWARTRYWGFDDRNLPLNARVWYPQGAGPFPLVLIVHGNHAMTDFSDPGYAYLGERLASRGFIFVSVDENFLNSGMTDILSGPDGGLREENDARAWLLLEHLRLWREWNRQVGSPFHGIVDLDRVALIGHSRGGEAAYVAAAFNQLPYYPDNAAVAFDYGFGIRSVVAIAPVDGQYLPAGTSASLENINFFVLQGAHDGDMRSFNGLRQYDRVRFTGEGSWFKSTAYVYGANHGQFNTRWGRMDLSAPIAWLFNLEPIMPAEEQTRIAQVFIGAFLEATLHDQSGYRALFRDDRAGSEWLPEQIYLQQYQEAADRFVSTYEEDLNITTTSLPGGELQGEHLSAWYEDRVNLKWGTRETNAVFLAWEAATGTDDLPTYRVILPEEGLILNGEERLFFSMGDSGIPIQADREENAPPPIDLTVEVADAAGNAASLPLSHAAYLQPRLVVNTFKTSLLSDIPKSEIIFQTFELPLVDFEVQNPAFDAALLQEVRFVFDRTPAGSIALDDLGFRE